MSVNKLYMEYLFQRRTFSDDNLVGRSFTQMIKYPWLQTRPYSHLDTHRWWDNSQTRVWFSQFILSLGDAEGKASPLHHYTHVSITIPTPVSTSNV